MPLKFSNNANSTLASGIGAGDLTFTVAAGQGARFPTLAGGDYSYITLINTSNVKEIVKVTARAGDVFTVPGGGRGLDGTIAMAFSSGDRVELRIPNIALQEFVLDSELVAQLAAAIPVTGDVKMTLRNTADTGWVMMNDGSIGNAASGGTSRANADTENLFTLLWNNIINQWCPVQDSAGVFVARGGSAAADFSANRRLVLPKMLGRAMAVSGLGSFTSLFTADAGTDTLTIDSNSSIYTGATVRVSNSGGSLPPPLAGVTDYFAIRTGATTVKLATTLANAHAGTAIDITGAGSGVNTITMSLTTHALGEHVGEESHSQKSTEVGPQTLIDPGHTHDVTAPSTIAEVGGGQPPSWAVNGSAQGDRTVVSQSRVSGITTPGLGTPANVIQPTTFLNAMIKL